MHKKYWFVGHYYIGCWKLKFHFSPRMIKLKVWKNRDRIQENIHTVSLVWVPFYFSTPLSPALLSEALGTLVLTYHMQILAQPWFEYSFLDKEQGKIRELEMRWREEEAAPTLTDSVGQSLLSICPLHSSSYHEMVLKSTVQWQPDYFLKDCIPLVMNPDHSF